MVTVGDYVYPEGLAYTDDHIWVKLDGNLAIIGIEPMGFAIAGKISMIRVKKEGKSLKEGRAFGTMESGKGVVPLNSPFSGKILEVNPLVVDKNFDEIMANPYNSWLVKIEVEAESLESATEKLMKDPAAINTWAKKEMAKIK